MIWNVSPEIFALGPLHLRWYGAFFTLAFILSYRLLKNMFSADGLGIEKVDSLLWYMIGGTVIGARLGHCLFYQPEIFLADPIRILKIWEGGLASHGATIGICTGAYLYSRKWKDYSPLEVLDRVSVGVAISGCFIRLGNFFNSEIVGKPAGVPWAVTFSRVDQLPRHPTQLYESLSYLIIFIVLYRLYWKTKVRLQAGYIFGACFVGIFISRFFLEFFKENQEAFENNLPLNLGQLLSIPFIAIGFYVILTSKNRMVAPKSARPMKKKT